MVRDMIFLMCYGGLIGFGLSALFVLASEGVTALFRTFKAIVDGR